MPCSLPLPDHKPERNICNRYLFTGPTPGLTLADPAVRPEHIAFFSEAGFPNRFSVRFRGKIRSFSPHFYGHCKTICRAAAQT
jgi:hypothetical protein